MKQEYYGNRKSKLNVVPEPIEVPAGLWNVVVLDPPNNGVVVAVPVVMPVGL